MSAFFPVTFYLIVYPVVRKFYILFYIYKSILVNPFNPRALILGQMTFWSPKTF